MTANESFVRQKREGKNPGVGIKRFNKKDLGRVAADVAGGDESRSSETALPLFIQSE